MTRQTLEILGERRSIDGYVEIGTTGRYVSALRKHVRFTGPLVLVNDVAPTNSPVDVMERGGLAKIGAFAPLADYAPIAPDVVADASIDVVTCFIGLHHARPDLLDAFVRSIARVLRPGGLFIVRDHDAATPGMTALVALAHTVFNLGLGLSWAANAAEPRYFVPLADVVRRVEGCGLKDTGARILQPNDPTANTLLAFVKEGPA
jgi:SAM-dependent methyltransferase